MRTLNQPVSPNRSPRSPSLPVPPRTLPLSLLSTVDFGEFVLAIAKFLRKHHQEHAHEDEPDGGASSVLADMIADIGSRNLRKL